MPHPPPRAGSDRKGSIQCQNGARREVHLCNHSGQPTTRRGARQGGRRAEDAGGGRYCGVVGAWIKARFSKTQVEPNPLPVAMADTYVTCEQCALRHAEVEKRFQAGNTAFKELRKEIAGMREDLHAGLGKINDRISPVAEACAANSAAIQILLKETKP